MKSFTDPYGEDSTLRLNADVGQEDLMFLRGMRSTRGTLQITTNKLIYKLCNELRKRNIIDFTKQSEFEQFIDEFEFVWPGHDIVGDTKPPYGSPVIETHSEAVTLNVRGGTPREGASTPNKTRKSADAKSGTSDGVGTRRSGGKTKSKKGEEGVE